jgi:hypothetical protein
VFNWFDPKSGTYKESKTQPFSVQASGDATTPNQAGETTQSTAQKGDGRHLHAIRYAAQIKDDRPAAPLVFVAWLGAGTSALAAAALLLGRLRGREKTREEIAREAKTVAQRGIRKARSMSGEPQVIYAELTRVARQYLNERFGISTGIGRDGLRAMLLKQSVNEAAIDRLLSELDNCDFARFAPGGHLPKEAEQAAERLEQVIGAVDEQKEAA